MIEAKRNVVHGEYIVKPGTKTIAEYAFCDIKNISYSDYDGPNAVIIPKTVTSIGSYAFGFCKNLESITLPISVVSIGPYAFAACDSLNDVYYAGSKEQKQKIKIDCDGQDMIPLFQTSVEDEQEFNGNILLLNATWHFDATSPDKDIQNHTNLDINTSSMQDKKQSNNNAAIYLIIIAIVLALIAFLMLFLSKRQHMVQRQSPDENIQISRRFDNSDIFK
ncbi:MAG: leucine-rich repeat domain-containing protein [Clostridia bacterium]|nr:leucine-rich repeat domain-containing protein [Clostridia bacterium]